MLTPKLSLDFTLGSLSPLVSLSRSGNTATRINSNGFIEVVNADVARFNYNPIALTCKGLFIEETRSNAFAYSNDFLNTATAGSTRPWVWTNSTITSNVVGIDSPDGTANSSKLVENNAAGVHTLGYATTATQNQSYSVSVFVKAGERKRIRIGLSSYASWTGGNGSECIFNLETGTATWSGGNGLLKEITQYSNGWYRCSISAVRTAATGSFSALIFLDNGTTASYTGDGASGVYLYGAQLEAGAFATSYIPTTTTALTRNADVATITGTNFSDFWQAVKGGASVLATPSTVSGIRPLVQFDDNTADNIIALRGNTTNPELYIVDGGVDQAQLDAGTIAVNTPYSLTGWWQTNNCKARQNSGATVSDYTATIPTVTQARIGSDGTNYLNGTIATINYYDSFFGRPIYTRRKNKVFASLL